MHMYNNTKVPFNTCSYFHTQTLVLDAYKSKEHYFCVSPRVHFCSRTESKRYTILCHKCKTPSCLQLSTTSLFSMGSDVAKSYFMSTARWQMLQVLFFNWLIYLVGFEHIFSLWFWLKLLPQNLSLYISETIDNVTKAVQELGSSISLHRS